VRRTTGGAGPAGSLSLSANPRWRARDSFAAVVIHDLDALASACRSIGLELVRGQTTYEWRRSSQAAELPPPVCPGYVLGQCEHAVRLIGNPGAFEIGLVPLENGGFGIVWDSWRGGVGLEDVAGPGCSSLIAEYARRSKLAA
jgi:hypothetical protein